MYYSDHGRNVAYSFPINMCAKKIDNCDDGNNSLLIGTAKVEFILPTKWPTTGIYRPKRSANPNDNSLVLSVSFDTHKILFTGDASGATLDAVVKNMDNTEKLKNVNCIVIPHHGSNRNGEFAWYYYVKDNIEKNFNWPHILTLISSDPKIGDRLPWFGVSKFRGFMWI